MTTATATTLSKKDFQSDQEVRWCPGCGDYAILNAVQSVLPELGIPRDPSSAFQVIFEGRTRVIDAGELDGHVFFNVAGIGLDARVAHRFALSGHKRRGFVRYLELAAREILSFTPIDCALTTDDDSSVCRVRPLLIAIANARQYGNGALIAPDACLDDGKLDVVVVEHRAPWRVLVQAPRLFSGDVARVPGVSIRRALSAVISADSPLVYHVDGEPYVGGHSVKARIHPEALRVVCHQPIDS